MNNLQKLQEKLRETLDENIKLAAAEKEFLLESIELFNEEELEKLIHINS